MPAQLFLACHQCQLLFWCHCQGMLCCAWLSWHCNSPSGAWLSCLLALLVVPYCPGPGSLSGAELSWSWLSCVLALLVVPVSPVCSGWRARAAESQGSQGKPPTTAGELERRHYRGKATGILLSWVDGWMVVWPQGDGQVDGQVPEVWGCLSAWQCARC